MNSGELFIALLESSGGQPLNSAGQPTGNEAFAHANRDELSRILNMNRHNRPATGIFAYDPNDASASMTSADRWQIQALAGTLGVNLNDYHVRRFTDMPENQQRLRDRMSAAFTGGALRAASISDDALTLTVPRTRIDFRDPTRNREMQMELDRMFIRYNADPLTGAISIVQSNISSFLPAAALNPTPQPVLNTSSVPVVLLWEELPAAPSPPTGTAPPAGGTTPPTLETSLGMLPSPPRPMPSPRRPNFVGPD